MLSRRSFLNGVAGMGLAAAAPGAEQAAAQAAQPPRRRLIIDAQVHLWKANTLDRPWPPNTTPAASGAVRLRQAHADDERGGC